ncbi:MAG: hypothetical protein ACRC4H_13610, partial [Plesiomonas sp.]
IEQRKEFTFPNTAVLYQYLFKIKQRNERSQGEKMNIAFHFLQQRKYTYKNKNASLKNQTGICLF